MNIAQSVSAMKKGQSSLEYLFIIGAVIVMAFIAVKYLEPTAKGVPITGVAYIDPEFSPEKPGYDHPVTWIVYKYPEGCKAKSTCDFYVSVNLHYYPSTNKYRVYVNADGDSNRIREVKVQLCTGHSATWKFPEDKGKNKINGKTISPDEFPCTVYIMAWEK